MGRFTITISLWDTDIRRPGFIYPTVDSEKGFFAWVGFVAQYLLQMVLC